LVWKKSNDGQSATPMMAMPQPFSVGPDGS
jgi:hypothetical protein